MKIKVAKSVPANMRDARTQVKLGDSAVQFPVRIGGSNTQFPSKILVQGGWKS